MMLAWIVKGNGYRVVWSSLREARQDRDAWKEDSSFPSLKIRPFLIGLKDFELLKEYSGP